MERICRIYTLAHPITGEIRYVGKTTSSLNRRLGQHIAAISRSKSHRASWIKSILKQGLKPIIELIEEVDYSINNQIEIYWIAQFKAWNFRLVNHTEGGEGTIGYRHSEESKLKMSLNALGNSRARGYKHSQETKELLRQQSLNRKVSLQTKEKLSKIRQENPSKTSSKEVININTGIVYKSIKQAAELNNINYNTLAARIQTNRGEFKLL